MKLDRVHEDLEAGRRWKALDRLQGMRSTAPADQAVLELLGRVRADMGELPEAGLAWFLTDGDDPRREAAFAAMRERHGRVPMQMAQKVKPRAPIEAFPPGAQARLRELQADLGQVGISWDPGVARDRDDVEPKEPSTLSWLAGVAGCLGLALLLILPWVRGVIAFFE